MKSNAKRQGRPQHCFLSCIWLLTGLLLLPGAAVENTKAQPITSCRASTEANKTTKCDVSYLYQLRLHCPSKSGICAKQSTTNASMSEVVCNCSHGQCILNPDHTLHNEDSGLYFCRDASNYLYVNINVLAPPSLPSICNTGCSCGNLPTYNECHMPFVQVNGLENGLVVPFSMTVNYTGNGPFEVQWLRNSVEIFCGGNRYSCKNFTSQVGTTVIHTQIITVRPPQDPRNYSESAGTYRATVINPYGSNSSITLAKFVCMEPRIPTPLAPPSPYINVTEGSRANGQCNIEIAKAAYLYICYGLQNETFGDLNKDTNCALCMGNSEGLCATMRAKPHWIIYRTVTDRCSSTIRTNFSINHTSVEDNGKIFCVWGDDVFPMQNYANFSLNVERKKMSDLQLAVYVGAPLAALTIVGLVTSLVVVVRKKLKQRHSPPLNSPDNDSEASPITGQYQGHAATSQTMRGNPSYGSMDRRRGYRRLPRNTDTAASGYTTDTESERPPQVSSDCLSQRSDDESVEI